MGLFKLKRNDMTAAENAAIEAIETLKKIVVGMEFYALSSDGKVQLSKVDEKYFNKLIGGSAKTLVENYDELADMAKENGESVSEFMRFALENNLLVDLASALSGMIKVVDEPPNGYYGTLLHMAIGISESLMRSTEGRDVLERKAWNTIIMLDNAMRATNLIDGYNYIIEAAKDIAPSVSKSAKWLLRITVKDLELDEGKTQSESSVNNLYG